MAAVEAAARCELSDDALDLLTSQQTIAELVPLLVEAELLDDAIRIWAAALPARQGIWWGSLCVWEAYRGNVSPRADDGFRTLVEWIEEPTDARRREAATLVKPAGAATPLGILLQALFHCGGSISPPDLPKFEPDPKLFTKLLAESVLLTAKQIGINQRQDRRVEFIARAEKIAGETITWRRDGARKLHP
jgi:hypothetical protein